MMSSVLAVVVTFTFCAVVVAIALWAIDCRERARSSLPHRPKRGGAAPLPVLHVTPPRRPSTNSSRGRDR